MVLAALTSVCLPSLEEGKDAPPCPAGCRKDVLRAHPHPLRVWCLKAASTFSCTSHSLFSAHSLPSSSLWTLLFGSGAGQWVLWHLERGMVEPGIPRRSFDRADMVWNAQNRHNDETALCLGLNRQWRDLLISFGPCSQLRHLFWKSRLNCIGGLGKIYWIESVLTLSLLRFREKPLGLVDACLILDSLEHCLKLFNGFCTLSRLIVALWSKYNRDYLHFADEKNETQGCIVIECLIWVQALEVIVPFKSFWTALSSRKGVLQLPWVQFPHFGSWGTRLKIRKDSHKETHSMFEAVLELELARMWVPGSMGLASCSCLSGMVKEICMVW